VPPARQLSGIRTQVSGAREGRPYTTYGNYIILYRNLPREVSIERVIHGARDILALLADTD
jgi:plasmid stabilization system protein ParE